MSSWKHSEAPRAMPLKDMGHKAGMGLPIRDGRLASFTSGAFKAACFPERGAQLTRSHYSYALDGVLPRGFAAAQEVLQAGNLSSPCTGILATLEQLQRTDAPAAPDHKLAAAVLHAVRKWASTYVPRTFRTMKQIQCHMDAAPIPVATLVIESPADQDDTSPLLGAAAMPVAGAMPTPESGSNPVDVVGMKQQRTEDRSEGSSSASSWTPTSSTANEDVNGSEGGPAELRVSDTEVSFNMSSVSSEQYDSSSSSSSSSSSYEGSSTAALGEQAKLLRSMPVLPARNTGTPVPMPVEALQTRTMDGMGHVREAITLLRYDVATKITPLLGAAMSVVVSRLPAAQSDSSAVDVVESGFACSPAFGSANSTKSDQVEEPTIDGSACGDACSGDVSCECSQAQLHDRDSKTTCSIGSLLRASDMLSPASSYDGSEDEVEMQHSTASQGASRAASPAAEHVSDSWASSSVCSDASSNVGDVSSLGGYSMGASGTPTQLALVLRKVSENPKVQAYLKASEDRQNQYLALLLHNTPPASPQRPGSSSPGPCTPSKVQTHHSETARNTASSTTSSSSSPSCPPVHPAQPLPQVTDLIKLLTDSCPHITRFGARLDLLADRRNHLYGIGFESMAAVKGLRKSDKAAVEIASRQAHNQQLHSTWQLTQRNERDMWQFHDSSSRQQQDKHQQLQRLRFEKVNMLKREADLKDQLLRLKSTHQHELPAFRDSSSMPLLSTSGSDPHNDLKFQQAYSVASAQELANPEHLLVAGGMIVSQAEGGLNEKLQVDNSYLLDLLHLKSQQADESQRQGTWLFFENAILELEVKELKEDKAMLEARKVVLEQQLLELHQQRDLEVMQELLLAQASHSA